MPCFDNSYSKKSPALSKILAVIVNKNSPNFARSHNIRVELIKAIPALHLRAGYRSERLQRQWLSIKLQRNYVMSRVVNNTCEKYWQYQYQ